MATTFTYRFLCLKGYVARNFNKKNDKETITQVPSVCFPVLGRLDPHRALLKTRLTGFSTP